MQHGTDMQTSSDDSVWAEMLSRVCLDRPLSEFISDICVRFDLHAPETFAPIQRGYQDLNVKLTTAGGRQYVIKVFSKLRTLTNIQDQVRALILLGEHGLPVPRLVNAPDQPVAEISDASGNAYVCVMEYFDGPSLEEIPPSDSDIVFLAGCLARMHQLPLKVSRYYDDWGAANLVIEFEAKREILAAGDLSVVEDVVSRFKTIDLLRFRQCAIHGDLYRAHVLKSSRGEYCIIDFGCLDYNAAVLDLAIFIAHLCLDCDLTPDQSQRIYKLATDAYCTSGSLDGAELAALPVLIAASYGAYIIATTSLIVQKNDRSPQTQQWMSISRGKLESFLQSGLVYPRD